MNSSVKATLTKLLPYITGLWVLLMLLSLKFGFFNLFFWADGQQGIDYWALPRGFLNLLNGVSLFDTFNGSQFGGPRSTWYLAHPAFEVFVSSWFTFFSPWVSYALFQVFSVGLIFYTGYLFAQQTTDKFTQQLCYFFVLFGFPVYWLLYVGNMHAPLILSIGLLLVALYEMAYKADAKNSQEKLMAGLLISLLTKPIVLIMLPLFLLLKETRITTVKSLVIYGVISLLFILVPFLNPESIGLMRTIELLLDPEFVKQNLNIYTNKFVLNVYMKDNSIHWLNLIAQSDFDWNQNIQIFSLSAFTNALFGTNFPSMLFKLPLLFAVLSSVGVVFIADAKQRVEAAILLVSALSLTFFLSYNTVWEYQLTSALPLIAFFALLKTQEQSTIKSISLWVIVAGALLYLPTAYVFYGSPDKIMPGDCSIIRLNRTLPVLVMYVACMWQVIQLYFFKKMDYFS